MNQEAIRETGYTETSDSYYLPESPVVSIYMLTYNHGPYLADAIEGVISQKTDFPIELVIGEDCSTDNTREIALDYQRRYPHLIRVIYSDKNVGMMANGWRTLMACRGEFIAFCEGDDYWIDPEKLCKQVDVLSRSKNIDISFHSCYHKYNKQNILSNVHSSTDKIFTLSEVITGGGLFMPTASIVIRRSLLISIQDWFDETMPPVGDYFLQVFGSRKGGAYYLNKPMCVYNKEIEVSWTKRTEKSIDAVVEFEAKFFFALRKLEHIIPRHEEAFKRYIISHYYHRLINIKNINLFKVRELMISVLKYLYESKEIIEPIIADKRLEREHYLRFAVDAGKVKDLEDQKCGVAWQFFRVVKSILDYGISFLKIINININNTSQPNLTDYERIITKWKAEVCRSYLIARWKRLCRLIAGAYSSKEALSSRVVD